MYISLSLNIMKKIVLIVTLTLFLSSCEKDDDMDTNSLASPNGETPRKVGRLTIDLPSGTTAQRQSRAGLSGPPTWFRAVFSTGSGNQGPS